MSQPAALNSVLVDITTGLEMLNAAAPDILAIKNLFTGTQQTIQQLLTDATTIETNDEAKIKTELGQ